MSKRSAATSPPPEAFAGLISAWHLLPPDEVPRLISEQAVELGATDATIYLVDHDQMELKPVPDPRGGLSGAPLAVDSTLPGRVFRMIEVLRTTDGDSHALWIPLLDGTERIGVLHVASDDAIEHEEPFVHLATLASELVITKGQYGDRFHRTRRTQRMTLAAELQWNLLPPLTFGTEDVLISGHVQPSYEVGGDGFDYAMNGHVLHVAIIDAMGHGLEASLLAAIALGAYRNGRRHGDALEDIFTLMDETIATQFGIERFVTALLAELDVDTGVLRWINAGHPAPLLVRGRQVVGSLHCEPTTPIGFGGEVAQIAKAQLEPADRLLLYTDGVVEGRDEQGRFFGVDRLAELVGRESSSGQPAPETMRRIAHAVMAHQVGALADDATTVFVEWKGQQTRLLP
jgi:serine phosphatase RsbU (regulator of sigma subunit)